MCAMIYHIELALGKYFFSALQLSSNIALRFEEYKGFWIIPAPVFSHNKMLARERRRRDCNGISNGSEHLSSHIPRAFKEGNDP